MCLRRKLAWVPTLMVCLGREGCNQVYGIWGVGMYARSFNMAMVPVNTSTFISSRIV